MNRKQLTILLVALVVLGGAGLLLRKNQSASWSGSNPAMGKKLLGEFPVNDVTQVTIKQGTNELNLAKKDDLWRVKEREDYPANYSEISEFLMKMRDLKVVQSEEIGPSQLARVSLVPGEGTNSAMVVDFKDQNGKPIRTLLLGKKHMRKASRPSPMGDLGDEGWPDGRYVKVGNASQVAVISDALSNVEPKPEPWLNKDFFKVEKIKSISVSYANATNSWKLSRETEAGEWKLADAKPGEQLDASKTSSFNSALGSPTFSDISSKMDLVGANPTQVAVETFENFNYALKVGAKTNDNYPLIVSVTADVAKERTPGKDEKPEDKEKLDKEFKEKTGKLVEKLAQEQAFGKWVYLVSSWTLDSVLKERSQLLVDKKDEKKDAAAKDAKAAGIKLDPTTSIPTPDDADKDDAADPTAAPVEK